MYKNIEEYNADKDKLEELINEATLKGMLEPDMDNEYTREIAIISANMADYEDNVLHIMEQIRDRKNVYYRVSMPVSLHDSVAKKASMLGQSVSEYISTIMARELNVAY